MLEDTVDRAATAVANQVANTRLRAIEVDCRIREADELEERLDELEPQSPEGKDLEGAIHENPELANDAADILGLMQEEQAFLACMGVDPRPYDRCEPRF